LEVNKIFLYKACYVAFGAFFKWFKWETVDKIPSRQWFFLQINIKFS